MYQKLIRPLLFQIDPEKAHHLAINSCRVARHTPGAKCLLKCLFLYENPIEIMGLKFPNRIGLAAGLDKNAQVADTFASMGFGFVEIGTVTPKSQPGNVKPRLFRIPQDNALINRMGFNNDGLDVIQKRLLRYAKRDFILGGNIGKNTTTDNSLAINDYQAVMNGIYDLVDYIVLNISCPNIANLCELQNKAYLGSLMSMMDNLRKTKDRYKPLVVKISPDLEQQQINETIELIKEYKFNGIIIANTTTSRSSLTISKEEITSIGQGGLSGKPLFKNTLKMVENIRKELDSSVAIIGSGGIFSVQDATDLYSAGADLLQVYTGFIYQGPMLIKKLSRIQM